MKKTARELIEIISQNDLLQGLFEGYFDELDDANGEPVENPDEYLESLGLGEIERKDGRCDTSEFWKVLYFKDHDVFLQIEGEYDSYGQGEHAYDHIREVKAKEVTTIVYE